MISSCIRLGLGLGVALVSAVSLDGCVSLIVGMTAPVVKIASADFNREADLDFAREASPGQIKTAEGFLAADPENRILLEVVTRGYIEYAFGFLEDDIDAMPDDPKHAADRERLTRRTTDLYDRALGFALRLVALEDKNFKDAFMKASPALLEPVAKAEITLPEGKLGDITGDLTGRRGYVEGMETQPGGTCLLRASVPLAEMTTYARTLSGMTGGQGSFVMEPSHYELVPYHEQQKIVAAANPSKNGE